MGILFAGIDLEQTTVSMTINSPASVLWAMYLAVAEKQGADWKKISGTIQNDILKEYIAQKEYIYPPAPSMRLVIDTFEFGSRFTPRFNTISISGYHIREAGDEQHRPRRYPGADRGAGRHPVAAHRCPRRSSGAAHRRSGAYRAAHATDHRLRKRRGPDGGPAGRQLLPGKTYARHGKGR